MIYHLRFDDISLLHYFSLVFHHSCLASFTTPSFSVSTYMSQLFEWPDCIQMHGLPFRWQGWNGVFQKTKIYSDGCPVYEMKPYNLYGMIPIIGARIQREHGHWVFYRSCDDEWLFKKVLGDRIPEGAWENGGFVTEVLRSSTVNTQFFAGVLVGGIVVAMAMLACSNR